MLVLGFAGYAVAAPATTSPFQCYVCCEDNDDCSSFDPSWWCEDTGIDCQDTVCRLGGGHDFCFEPIIN